jgi:hypothetical protein
MKTEIIAIQDRSGSMAPLHRDVVGGYNTFLAEQRAVPGEARITCVQFNDEVRTLYQALPLSEVKDMGAADYLPTGSTALLDAIGSTLTAQAERIAAEGWAELVIVHINTDGEENASHQYTLEQVKTMITHAQDKGGWVFLFQAANQDAFAAGGKYGISAATTSNFAATGAGLRGAYGAMSMSVTNLRNVAAQPPAGPLADAIASVPLPPAQPSGVLPDAVAGLQKP